MKLIVETDAFVAYRTAEGIIIHQKSKASLKTGLMLIAIGIPLFFLSQFIPAEDMPRKWMEWLIDPGFFYGSIISGIAGVGYTIKGVFFKKSKPILFDKHTKELHLRFVKIPFREIEDLHLVVFPFIGGRIANIKFKHKGLRRSLIYTASIVKNTEELDALVQELSEMTKKAGY